MADNSANALYRKQQGMAPVTQSYEPVVVDWIKKAAAATGADPRALLATAIQESGARLHPDAGDGGTSFGTFQFHRGGALGAHPPAWASTYESFLNRAQEFARLGVHGGKGAAAVQRPLDRSLYARGVDSYLEQAAAILGQAAPPKTKTKTAKPKGLGKVALPAPETKHAGDPVGNEILAAFVSRQTGRPSSGNAIQDLISANASRMGLAAPTLLPQVGQTPVAATPAPASASVKPKAPTVKPSVLGKAGGGWAGSHNLALAMAAIGKRNGLSIASEKRSRRNTTSGNMSDHYVGNKTAYAFDLSNGSNPTPQMDKTAADIAASLGVKNWKGGVLNVNKGGYRYQVLYRTHVGGNHFNHVHVGVRKL